MKKLVSHLIFGFIFLLSLPILAENSSLSQQKFTRDGEIRFYVYHTNTTTEYIYLNRDGEWIPEIYEKMNFLLRSYSDNKVHAIDKRLIELADHLQDYFKVDTIEVISGYRSPAYNQKLKSEGHNVASESYHTKGMALDIHIDEINEKTLRDYLKKIGLGGVGYYGQKLMVHMDFGPKRFWSDSGFRENTKVGIFNKKSSRHLQTQKFYFLKNEVIVLKKNFDLKPNDQLQVQYFFRGKWIDLKKKFMDWQKNTENLTLRIQPHEHLFAKYRVRIFNSSQWQNSNEFYIKRSL